MRLILDLLVISALSATAALAQRSQDALSEWRNDLLKEINAARSHGRHCGDRGYFPQAAPVRYDEILNVIAQAYAQDMAQRGFYSHVNPDGQTLANRLESRGYETRAFAENLHCGPPALLDDVKTLFEGKEVLDENGEHLGAVKGWLASPGHCANVMNPAYDVIGFGVAQGRSPLPGKANYFVLEFARSSN